MMIDIKAFSDQYEVRLIKDADVPCVYMLCSQNALYYQYCPPFVTEDSIREDMTALPPKKTSDDKYYVGYFDKHGLVAVMDLIMGFPNNDTSFIGFFMTDASVQNKGVGSSIIADLCAYLSKIDISFIRLGWVKGNPQAEHFWHKNGFTETGITYETDGYTVIVAQREIKTSVCRVVNGTLFRKGRFLSKELIDKGWSGDKKYCVTTADGTKYLLRITPEAKSAKCGELFRMQQEAAALGVPMCRPVEMGRCDEGIYMLQSWIDGRDAEDVVPYLADSAQYALGLEAGRILKQIHTIPAPEDQPSWENRFNAKTDRKIKAYEECPISFEGADKMIGYIKANRFLLADRPQVFQHGDYHIGNMMIEDGKIVIIDFDRYDFGDPWEEFNRIVWSVQTVPIFASGIVNGYFDGQVPPAFWKLLALYISSNTLSSIPWAVRFGHKEIQTMLKQAKDVLGWYDNMRNPIPTWYFEGYYLQYIDGLPYKMKAPFDFGFMSQYGKVFKVFDDQDSGNICFGTEKDGEKFFVKFAGAPTEAYNGTAEEAIARLRSTLPVYEDLKHESLIKLVKAEDVGGGFAMIFQWVDGHCMGRSYPAEHRRFMQLPMEEKCKVFQDVLDFLDYVTSNGYVAIDFYDSSIMYDPETHRTTICDIDFFRKQPCVNDMGRMWGSSRFQSPEEYQLHAEIDEITNVYTAGATAFALFGNCHRTRDAWQLGDAAFQVAAKAVSEDRRERYQSIQELVEAWNISIGE